MIKVNDYEGIPGCVAMTAGNHELAVALEESFKKFDKHSVKFVETFRDGRLFWVGKDELEQEELLDKTYSQIVHEFDKVIYTWFIITFNDKLGDK